MIKIIKKSLIILLLVTINIIVFIAKIIHNFYKENKSKIENYSKSFYTTLKEELDNWKGRNLCVVNITMEN